MIQPQRRATVTVTNPMGLHLRPADMIVKLVHRFEAEVWMLKGNHRVNGGSILDVISLGAPAGTELEIEAYGQQADAVVDALIDLFQRNFSSEEEQN